MSHTHSTKKSSYSHLSATERGEISAYLKMGKQAAEIARLLGRHRSTISREIKRGSVTQVQDKNGKLIYSTVYFPDSGQRVYEENRKNSVYLKLNKCSSDFFDELAKAVKARVRCHSVDSFVHTYREQHPLEMIPSTKTIYRYIAEGLLAVDDVLVSRCQYFTFYQCFFYLIQCGIVIGTGGKNHGADTSVHGHTALG